MPKPEPIKPTPKPCECVDSMHLWGDTLTPCRYPGEYRLTLSAFSPGSVVVLCERCFRMAHMRGFVQSKAPLGKPRQKRAASIPESDV